MRKWAGKRLNRSRRIHGVLTHIVSFKYKADTPESARHDHRARLRALKDANIDGVIDLTVGADMIRSPRSYDAGLVVLFRDRASLDAYQTHPAHVPVAQFGAGLCEHIVAVDFID
jgi:hypothetical protein